MDKFKLCSGSVYGKSCYDKVVLKDVFLHGKTRADMSIFPIDSTEIISSYDKRVFNPLPSNEKEDL